MYCIIFHQLKKKIGNELSEHPSIFPDDFRMFCGDLGNEVTDETLTRVFSKFPTFVKAKVVRDKKTNKTKGYGFVSFRDPIDFARAMREMNGKIFFLFFEKKLEDTSSFCEATNTPVLESWSFLGFKANVDSFVCMLHRLRAMDSPDSHLVQHLLASWRPEDFLFTFASKCNRNCIQWFHSSLTPTDVWHAFPKNNFDLNLWISLAKNNTPLLTTWILGRYGGISFVPLKYEICFFEIDFCGDLEFNLFLLCT